MWKLLHQRVSSEFLKHQRYVYEMYDWKTTSMIRRSAWIPKIPKKREALNWQSLRKVNITTQSQVSSILETSHVQFQVVLSSRVINWSVGNDQAYITETRLIMLSWDISVFCWTMMNHGAHGRCFSAWKVGSVAGHRCMCQSAQLGQSGRTLQRDAGRTDGGIGVETDDTDAALSFKRYSKTHFRSMICSQKFRKIKRKLELLKEISKLLIRHLHVSSWFSSCLGRGTGHAVAGSKYGHHGKRDIIIARHQQSETTLAGKGNFGDPRTGMHGRNRPRLLSFWHKCWCLGTQVSFAVVCHLFWLESNLQVFFGKVHEICVFPLVVCFQIKDIFLRLFQHTFGTHP